MTIYKRSIYVLSLVILATGCARYSWVKPGATQADFSADKYQCIKETASLYQRTQPAQNQYNNPQYPQVINTDCSASLDGRSTKCTSTLGKNANPYHITTIYEAEAQVAESQMRKQQAEDAKLNSRTNAMRSCMEAKGWYIQRVK